MQLWKSAAIIASMARLGRRDRTQVVSGIGVRRPVVVSFYGGISYYYECAERLRSDCEAFGLKHDIQEVVFSDSADWVVFCRHKIAFLKMMHEKHDEGILWIDVDSRILRQLDFVGASAADFGFFARGFKYIRDFDPTVNMRMFSPGVLYFGPSAAARSFLSIACAIERSKPFECATDDYFLQEAWLQTNDMLHLEIFPPSYANYGKTRHAGAYIQIGHSGSVKDHRSRVLQHALPVLQSKRKRVILEALANEAESEGRADAAEFYRAEIARSKSFSSKIARALRKK